MNQPGMPNPVAGSRAVSLSTAGPLNGVCSLQSTMAGVGAQDLSSALSGQQNAREGGLPLTHVAGGASNCNGASSVRAGFTVYCFCLLFNVHFFSVLL